MGESSGSGRAALRASSLRFKLDTRLAKVLYACGRGGQQCFEKVKVQISSIAETSARHQERE